MASLDPTYTCPPGANDTSYGLHATLVVQNRTSSAVLIQSVTAELTLESVSGPWLEKVGDRYEAGNIAFTPAAAAAGADTSVAITIPSACTNGKSASTTPSHGDYSVKFVMTTSAGVSTVTSRDRHRIATT